MYPILISGFADEISSDFITQLKSLKQLGISYIALRSINGKNILDFTYEEFKKDVYPYLVEYDIHVSSIGSPIGKVKIDDEKNKMDQLKKFHELIKIMELVKTRYVRVFSLFVEDHSDASFSKVVQFFKELLRAAQGKNVVILHENEKDIYGDQAIYCKKIMKTLNHPQLKFAFDTANFVQVGDDAMEAYLLLKEDIEYMHIKDAIKTTSENVLIGQGNGYVKEITQNIINSGYKGFFTLEPHLADFAYLNKLEINKSGRAKNSKPFEVFQATLEVFLKFIP
ncbi:MAG: sugar phosphate isomerase/epimerase [Firmicutes bacterium]|nr:sugar phosphate isomerase/epimerase [Bacillota bacterium]